MVSVECVNLQASVVVAVVRQCFIPEVGTDGAIDLEIMDTAAGISYLRHLPTLDKNRFGVEYSH